ncbi:MAG: DUF2892 domain-containing protein [Nanoarchaeota archaeon]
MKQNLGKLDRIFRFALAFWWLGPWMPYYRPSWINVVVAVIAWIALLESLSGWCFLHQLASINNKNQ